MASPSSWSFVIAGLIASPAFAQESTNTRVQRWDQLSNLEPGTRIAVTIEDSYHGAFGKRVKGTWVAADPEGITVQLSAHQARTIPKNAVARISAKTNGRPCAPWLGLVVGTAIGAGIVNRTAGNDLVASGQLAIGALFGGPPGAVAGYLWHRSSRRRVVYRRARTSDSSGRDQSSSAADGSLTAVQPQHRGD